MTHVDFLSDDSEEYYYYSNSISSVKAHQHIDIDTKLTPLEKHGSSFSENFKLTEPPRFQTPTSAQDVNTYSPPSIIHNHKKYIPDIISENSLNQKVENPDTGYPTPPLQEILPDIKYLIPKKKCLPNQPIITEEDPLTINPLGFSQNNH